MHKIVFNALIGLDAGDVMWTA